MSSLQDEVEVDEASDEEDSSALLRGELGALQEEVGKLQRERAVLADAHRQLKDHAEKLRTELGEAASAAAKERAETCQSLLTPGLRRSMVKNPTAKVM